MGFEHKKTLVLDFGGVITKTLFETHAETERALGLPAGTLTWRGPFAPETDPLWQDMQADRISERDYWRARTRQVGALVGQDWTRMAQFLVAARGDQPDAVIRPEFLETLGRVRALGHRVAILSNELDLFYGPDFRTRLSFLPQIDLIHDATYTDTLKPAAAAYENLVTALGVAPGDCVFVDDQARNIAGAEAVGMIAVQFDVRDPAASYRRAERLLGATQRIPT